MEWLKKLNNATEEANNIVKNLNQLIFSESIVFLLKMRILLEIIMYWTFFISKKNNQNEDLNELISLLNDQEKLAKKINDEKKDNQKIKKNKNLQDEISYYIHYKRKKDNNVIEKRKIKELEKEINNLIKDLNSLLEEEGDLKKFEEIKINDDLINESISFTDTQEGIKVISIGDYILKTTKEAFIIPTYQRMFTWTCKEINNLINSISKISLNNENNNDLDLGIIYISNKNQIIDGQQRLFAIYIISYFLKEELEDDSEIKIFLDSFSFERERRIDNHFWRNNFKKLKEVLEKTIHKEDEILIDVYDELKIVLNKPRNKDKKFWEKFKTIKFGIKIIDEKDAKKYFSLINHSGIKLTDFENIFSGYLWDKNVSGENKDNIIDIWEKYDSLKNIEFVKKINFLSKYLVQEKKWKLEEIIWTINFLIQKNNLTKMLFFGMKKERIFYYKENFIWEKEINNDEWEQILKEVKIWKKNKNEDEEQIKQKILLQMLFNDEGSKWENQLKELKPFPNIEYYFYSLFSIIKEKNPSYFEDKKINDDSQDDFFYKLEQEDYRTLNYLLELNLILEMNKKENNNNKIIIYSSLKENNFLENLIIKNILKINYDSLENDEIWWRSDESKRSINNILLINYNDIFKNNDYNEGIVTKKEI